MADQLAGQGTIAVEQGTVLSDEFLEPGEAVAYQRVFLAEFLGRLVPDFGEQAAFARHEFFADALFELEGMLPDTFGVGMAGELVKCRIDQARKRFGKALARRCIDQHQREVVAQTGEVGIASQGGRTQFQRTHVIKPSGLFSASEVEGHEGLQISFHNHFP